MVQLAITAATAVAILIGIAYVTRSVLLTLLGGLLMVALVVTSLFIGIAGDVTDTLDYLAHPDKPILVALVRDDQPIAAARVDVDGIKGFLELVGKLQSPDLAERARAEVAFRLRFEHLIPQEKLASTRMASEITQAVIDTIAQGLPQKDLLILGTNIVQQGWPAVARRYHRVVILRMDMPFDILEGRLTTKVTATVGERQMVLEVANDYVLDCVEAPDCGKRLAAALREPARAVASIDGERDVDAVLDETEGMRDALGVYADYVPSGSVSNLVAAALGYYLALSAVPPERVAPTLVGALQSGGIEIYPKTAIPTLFDGFVGALPEGIIANIARSAAGATEPSPASR